MRPLPALLATAGLLLVSPATPSAAFTLKPATVLVRGQVTDSLGAPVADQGVRLLATRRVAKFLTIESQPAQAELASVRTDANGFYEMRVPRNPEYDFFFLRFFTPGSFDRVRFDPPADREITGRFSSRRPVIQDCVLPAAPGWDAVQRLLQLYGADSPRGRVIRSLGVPDRVEPVAGASGREAWQFAAAGVVYFVEGDQVVDRRALAEGGEVPAVARH